MGKKNLDELFQEKFTDFEQVPDEKVWQAIEASLDKKKRRVIPLWWKLGGVAAVLGIGLLAINPFASFLDGEPSLTDVEQRKTDSLKKIETKEAKILNSTDANETELTDVNSQDNEKGTAKDNEYGFSKNINSDPKNNVKLSPSSKAKEKSQLTSSQKENRHKAKSNKITPEPNSLITDVPNNKAIKDIDPKDNLEPLDKNLQEGIAGQEDVKKSITDKAAEEAIVQQGNKSNPINKDEEGVLNEKVGDTGIAQNDIIQKDNKTEEELSNAGQKKSIFEEIDKQEEAVVAENEPTNRWSAGPSIAPVYFDAFGEGSPVHSILVPNSKSGETNLSYGLSVAYQINKRLSVRSGLHKVDYGYDTGDIEFSSSLDGAITDQMDNIDYATTARNLVVRSKAGSMAVSVNESSTEQAVDAQNASTSIARNGSMSQQFGYLEVPVELNYALVDRKMGINLIGGFSSLFLVNNSVSLSSGDETTQMGEANNVNNINFSTNIGLGIDYDFTPKIKMNIEPLFKYQLNTFSEVDGTFNPFSIGVYSGLTFSF